MNTDIILYDYWRSSASYRVRIALNLTGLSYQKINIDLLAKAHKSPTHLVRNPQGLVPVLEIDGQSFTQSLAIVEYLNETRFMKWLPDDPVQREKIRALGYILAVDVHPLCNLSVVEHVTKISSNQESDRKNWMHHFIRPGLRAFEQHLRDFDKSPFVNGEKPGFAEICLIPQLYNADRWDVDYSDCSNIIGLRDVCAKDSAFLDAFPEKSN